MLEENKDYLRQKAQQLNLGRQDALQAAQKLLDGLYPGQARAVSLNTNTLKITTNNASVAGELRLRQIELKNQLAGLGLANVSLQIMVASQT